LWYVSARVLRGIGHRCFLPFTFVLFRPGARIGLASQLLPEDGFVQIRGRNRPWMFSSPGADTEKPGRSPARARIAGSSARGQATYHQLRPLRREAIARVTMGTPFPCFLSSS